MLLLILRGVFILLTAVVAILYVLPIQSGQQVEFEKIVLMIALTLVVAGGIIAADILSPRKRLSAISGVFLGLIAGLLAAYALSFMVDLIGVLGPRIPEDLLRGVKVFIGLVTCYISISMVLQTRDDFRFVIPYVEFAKQIRGPRPTILDTSVLVDGRIQDIANTKALQGLLIVPKFVLNEVQTIADSANKLRRARGRRALDILQKLRENPYVDVAIQEAEAEGANVDQMLVSLSQDMRARLMTNDFNLAKVAVLRNVDVINLNDLANALRPVVLPGEQMQVKIIKPGESASQGVGYLEDGTMVVVENARRLMGHEVDLVVTSTLQTSAGRMIFGRHGRDEEEIENGASPTPTSEAREPAATDASPPAAETTPPSAAESRQPARAARAGSSGRNPRRGN